MPTLNEAEGMRQIFPRIDRDWIDQILVVDGQSTDDTVAYAKSQGCDTYLQQKKGIRHAYQEGFKLIKGEIVITFSPDGNCIPELIPELVQKVAEGYDMVICSRYARGAKSDDDDIMTGFGNWLFTKTINILHGGNYTDAMGIYRAYRTNVFYEMALDREDSYLTEKVTRTVIGIEPLLSVRAAKRKLKTTEIPGDEPARIAGIRKLQAFRWGGAYMLQIWREKYFWR